MGTMIYLDEDTIVDLPETQQLQDLPGLQSTHAVSVAAANAPMKSSETAWLMNLVMLTAVPWGACR